MVSVWWLLSIPFVFLLGFCLAAAFAMADRRGAKHD